MTDSAIFCQMLISACQRDVSADCVTHRPHKATFVIKTLLLILVLAPLLFSSVSSAGEPKKIHESKTIAAFLGKMSQCIAGNCNDAGGAPPKAALICLVRAQ